MGISLKSSDSLKVTPKTRIESTNFENNRKIKTHFFPSLELNITEIKLAQINPQMHKTMPKFHKCKKKPRLQEFYLEIKNLLQIIFKPIFELALTGKYKSETS